MAKYKKGQSGNPKGKPKGAKDKRTILRKLLEPQAKELVQKAVDMALGGDTTALRLCLERLIPPMKAEPVIIENMGESLSEKGNAVFAAIAEGRIEPTIGANLMQALGNLARIVETDELEKRIKVLEGKYGREY